MAKNADQPYGDVEYADPGYQDDGKKRYPIDTEEHVRSAWSYINKATNADMYDPRDLKRVKARIVKAGERFGIDFADQDSDTETAAEDSAERSRPREVTPDFEIVRFDRYWAVEDITRGGADGREVTAYAAVFEQPSEIQDQHGHYVETIDRSAFRRTLSHPGNIDKVQFLWNHGYHVDGSPSAVGSVPIGRLLDVKADDRGLLTRAKFNRSELAEHVLEAIKNGDVRGYSFRGRVFRSDPMRVPRIQRGGALPNVRRIELGLSDLGPTGTPWYSGTQIVAVRSDLAGLRERPLRERIEIARALLADDGDTTDLAESTVDPAEDAPATPDVSEVDTTDPADAEPTPSDDEGPGAEDSPEGALLPAETARSLSAADIRRRARIALITRGQSLKEGN